MTTFSQAKELSETTMNRRITDKVLPGRYNGEGFYEVNL